MNKIITVVLLLLCVLTMKSYAQKQVVLIKVYHQNLDPFQFEEVSLNDGPFASLDKNGQIIMQVNVQELPPKSIHLKNEGFEVATWSYNNGKVEVVVRRKTTRLVRVAIYDEEEKPLKNHTIRYQQSEAKTDASGWVQLRVPLTSAIEKGHFEIDAYTAVRLEAQRDNEFMLRIQSLAAPATDKPDPTPLSYAQVRPRKAGVKLDSIDTFLELYHLFHQLDVNSFDASDHQRIDEKFRELLAKNEGPQKIEPDYVQLITDSSKVKDDVKNLVMQAQSDREVLSVQRKKFDKSAQTIQNKLALGLENLSQGERTNLISELEELERILQENEQFFSANHEYYLDLLSTMKEKFFDMSALENKLSISEMKRLAEQRQFQQRILIISGLVFLFAILIVLLLRSERRLRKVNAKISELNENLEEKVFERTKMLTLANKELDTFLYRASHDLRSPVCSIIGLCNIATHVANQESFDLLKKVTDTVQVMDKLLKKLSVISEINEPTGFNKVYIREHISNALKDFEETISSNNVSVNVQCEEELFIHSYPNLLHVVLSNLIENALFYSLIKNASQATIEIIAQRNEGKVQIIIGDNGIGIDQKIKSHLFDMFFKGNENSKGNGLGLYIVHKSVQALEGDVEVESKPGEYTKFSVTLPIEISAKPISSTQNVEYASLEEV